MVRDYPGLGAPRNPERIVKPHKDYYVRMPIMVCDSFGNAWYENKKHTWQLIELIEYVRRNWPRDKTGSSKRTQPIMFVCENPHRVLQFLHEYYKDDPEWNFQVRKKPNERFHTDGKVKETKIQNTADFTVGFFGFRNAHRKTKYFHPISPHDFLDFRKYETELPINVRLYKFGGVVRAFMRTNRMRFSNSRSGLSSQLLRDQRFYSKPRRKVPKATNEKARLALPGNFYQTVKQPGYTAKIYVIDQENAHHYAAETVPLPSANYLFGRGRFGTSDDGKYARAGSDLSGRLLSEYGLFRVRALVPRHLQGYLPPWAETNGKGGIHSIWLYSNEIQFARELGVDIRGVSYAWTSDKTDLGLPKYARYAKQYVSENDQNRAWLKPLFLSAYGLLGGRPRHIESAYYRSVTGEDRTYFLAATPVELKHIKTKSEIQSPIVNVIQRGIIEAETRKLSIQLARKLSDEKHDVIGIHADAVLVRDTGQNLPLLPPPWRIKEVLHRFELVDKVSYISEKRSVLPGRRRGKHI